VGRLSRDLRRGARFEPVELPEGHARIAAEAARILKLEVCAVDMLDVDGGPHVFEVNASPSIREAEAVCGVDVAARIVDRAVALSVSRDRPPGRRKAQGASDRR